METSPSFLKGYSTFSVVIESPFPKRQRTDSPSFDSCDPVPEDHDAGKQSMTESNTTPDSLKTKPSSEPSSPMPSASTPIAATTTTPQSSKRRKRIKLVRNVITEVPQPLTEPYTAQISGC